MREAMNPATPWSAVIRSEQASNSVNHSINLSIELIFKPLYGARAFRRAAAAWLSSPSYTDLKIVLFL